MKQLHVFILLFVFGGSVFGQEVLDLNACIKLALQNNSTLKQREYANESAEFDVTGSYSNILPSVDLSLRKGETNIGKSVRVVNDVVTGVDPVTQEPIYGTARITTPKQYSKDHSLTLSVNQTLYDGGRWWNQIGQAKIDKKSSSFNLEGEHNRTILEVQANYYELLKQIKLYEVNKVAVQRSEDQLHRTEKMFELGSKARLDVYQAKVNLGNDRISLLTQKNIVEDARRTLNMSMGRDPETPLEIEKINEISPAVPELNALVDQAMENQPTLKKNEADVESSSYGVSLAQANYLPRLTAYFQYNRRNSDLERIYSKLNFDYVWAVGLSLNWNLFNGMGDYVNVQKAKISEKSAQEEQARYVREMKSKIQGYHDNYQSYLEIIAINEENLEAAKEELRLAEERYQIGAGTALEVREAQVKLTRAEQTLIAAQYNALTTLAQLDNEIGITAKKLEEMN
ncbi:MAG: TolC family protein [Calditrichae bacterium]|nr:TolC family protein [Calditrichota bacterium]MCB9059670.1 TolC family protein [Calditrichia bacterium]